jgi:hypothetical protein
VKKFLKLSAGAMQLWKFGIDGNKEDEGGIIYE